MPARFSPIDDDGPDFGELDDEMVASEDKAPRSGLTIKAGALKADGTPYDANFDPDAGEPFTADQQMTGKSISHETARVVDLMRELVDLFRVHDGMPPRRHFEKLSDKLMLMQARERSQQVELPTPSLPASLKAKKNKAVDRVISTAWNQGYSAGLRDSGRSQDMSDRELGDEVKRARKELDQAIKLYAETIALIR